MRTRAKYATEQAVDPNAAYATVPTTTTQVAHSPGRLDRGHLPIEAGCIRSGSNSEFPPAIPTIWLAGFRTVYPLDAPASASPGPSVADRLRDVDERGQCRRRAAHGAS